MTQVESAQLTIKQVNVPDNPKISPKNQAQVVIDFSSFVLPIGTTALEVDVTLANSNQPSQNADGFRTLCLCMEFDWNFGMGADEEDGETTAGDLFINVSDTGFQWRVPGGIVVNSEEIGVAPTVPDQLFVRNMIIPIVANQNSVIKFTKMIDGPIVLAEEPPPFSGKATIVLLNYDIPPVTLS
jgi:hypothetical protein